MNCDCNIFIFYIPLSLSPPWDVFTLHPTTVFIFFTALLQTTQNVLLLEQWGNLFGDLKRLDVIEDVIYTW